MHPGLSYTVGRRIAKSVDRDGAGAAIATIERLVYDGEHITLTFDGNGTQTNRYLHGTSIDQILASENAQGQVQWALTDNLGTVRDLIDSSGTVQNHIIYDSYGNVTTQTKLAIDFRFGYTGREWDDAETGQYHYRARYYDAGVGRFVSEDPIGFAGEDTNLYRYVSNSPVNAIDPSGLITYVLPGGGGKFGNLPGNLASGAIYPVVAIPNPPGTNAFTDPFGLVRSANAIAVAEAILNLGGGLRPGEPINIIAHSDANQAIVEKLVITLKVLNLNATIEVGRLDPTGVFKPSFLLCNTYDIGSNNPLSIDPRDLAALAWGLISPPDYRASFGVSHTDLLNDREVLRQLQSRFVL